MEQTKKMGSSEMIGKTTKAGFRKKKEEWEWNESQRKKVKIYDLRKEKEGKFLRKIDHSTSSDDGKVVSFSFSPS